jgi:hypothetical protein
MRVAAYFLGVGVIVKKCWGEMVGEVITVIIDWSLWSSSIGRYGHHR